MRPLLVHVVNCLLLALTLVGIPAATSVSFAGLRISKMNLTGILILALLGSQVLWNVYLRVSTKNKWTRRTTNPWLFISATLLAVYLGLYLGHLNFNWLKDLLIHFNTLYKQGIPSDKY